MPTATDHGDVEEQGEAGKPVPLNSGDCRGFARTIGRTLNFDAGISAEVSSKLVPRPDAKMAEPAPVGLLVSCSSLHIIRHGSDAFEKSSKRPPALHALEHEQSLKS